ncbi:MAG TPA: AAA family ATPase [Pseudonocardiaceae bacterium]|nr:AAA family ATPase [Pseudonocardiaceae bacterium]
MVSTPLSLVGRDRELSWLLRRVTDTVAGRGHVVLVEGEPGIGKTALVRAVCAAAADRGATVFLGAGDELARALPLVPLLDALEVSESSPDPDRAAVIRLLHGDTKQSTADLVAAAGERLIGLVDDACGRGPTVLAIDDLHWADRVTIAVWGRLVRLLPHLRLLLIGTVRPGTDRDELAVARTKRANVERMFLGPLSRPAVQDLVTRLAGGSPAPALTALAQGAAGNPLYLTELVEALARDGGLDLSRNGIAGITDGGAPRSLSSAIESRLGFLGEDTHLVLRAAALLGVRFSVADLGVVLRRRVAELIPALDASCVAGVLEDVDGYLSFRHPFVRSALYEGIPVAVRAAWHLEAARALAEAGAAVDHVARQLIAACDLRADTPHERGADDWMLTWLVANSAALASKAPAAAAKILREAVEPATGDERHAVLVCRLAEALYRAGDLAEAERVAVRGLAEIGDVACLTDLHATLAQCRSMTGRAAESLRELDTALAAGGFDGRHRARLQVLAARARWNVGDLDAADRLAETTLAETTLADTKHEAHDPMAAGWALHVRTIVCLERGRMRQALPLFDQALHVVRGDPAMTDLLLLLQINRALALAGLNRADEAIAAARDVREQADHAGHVLRMAQASSALGQLLYDSGGWDDALVEVELLPDDLKNPLVCCCDHGIAALIGLHRGSPAARSHLATVQPYQRELGERVVPALALATSLAAEQAGSADDALAILLAAGGLDVEDLLPEIVRLAVGLGDADNTRLAVARVAALAADTCVPHRNAALSYCRGLCDGGGETLLQAATGYRDAGRPLSQARALEAAALAFAEDGATSSAKAAFARAVDLYAALGAEWDVARAQALLRPHGIRRGPHATHRQARTGWLSLTQAEATVAALVMAGLSNRQIAERLFLSPRTIATHVSHILAKLQVRSRTDIAREASQRQSASG